MQLEIINLFADHYYQLVVPVVYETYLSLIQISV